MNLSILIAAVIGFLLSIYTIIIEYKHNNGNNYKAICDIGENSSCTKAFKSEYGKIFGVSNSYLGILFYILVFSLTLTIYSRYVFYITVLAILASVYLAYIQYVKMKNFCLVCTSIYVINILLLIFSYRIF